MFIMSNINDKSMSLWSMHSFVLVTEATSISCVKSFVYMKIILVTIPYLIQDYTELVSIFQDFL